MSFTGIAELTKKMREQKKNCAATVELVLTKKFLVRHFCFTMELSQNSNSSPLDDSIHKPEKLRSSCADFIYNEWKFVQNNIQYHLLIFYLFY